MTEGLGKFMDDFAALVQLAQARQQRFPRGEQLLDALSEHLGLPANEVPVVVEEISAHRFADVDILLAELAAEDPERRLVVGLDIAE